MKIESSEFEHERVYFKQFGAERVKQISLRQKETLLITIVLGSHQGENQNLAT